jgi:hypothetical protein
VNTRIGYRYADKRDCRQYTAIVVAGTITWEQIAPFLVQQRFFIPGQLGLEDLQYRFALPGADQPWHQLEPHDLKPTAAEPTIPLTAEALAERFAQVRWNDGPTTGQALRPSIRNDAAPAEAVPSRVRSARTKSRSTER